jgi:hypothetical protein
MKGIPFVIAIVIAFIFTADAKIGETTAEVEARYGSAGVPAEEPRLKGAILFKKAGVPTVAYWFRLGKVTAEFHWDVAEDEALIALAKEVTGQSQLEGDSLKSGHGINVYHTKNYEYYITRGVHGNTYIGKQLDFKNFLENLKAVEKSQNE